MALSSSKPGSGLDVARRFVDALVNGEACAHDTFDHTALQGLTVVDVSPGRMVCEMPVEDRVQNRYRTLHGGCTATLADTISTAALLTVCPYTGVSVNLAVNYLSPMPGGDTVVVDCTVTKVGKQLATIGVELRRKSTRQLVATATHTKFLQVHDPTAAQRSGGQEAQPRSKL